MNTKSAVKRLTATFSAVIITDHSPEVRSFMGVTSRERTCSVFIFQPIPLRKVNAGTCSVGCGTGVLSSPKPAADALPAPAAITSTSNTASNLLMSPAPPSRLSLFPPSSGSAL